MAVSDEDVQHVRRAFESFNATNTPALGNPNTQVGNVNFGRISTAGAARSNQVAVKLSF